MLFCSLLFWKEGQEREGKELPLGKGGGKGRGGEGRKRKGREGKGRGREGKEGKGRKEDGCLTILGRESFRWAQAPAALLALPACCCAAQTANSKCIGHLILNNPTRYRISMDTKVSCSPVKCSVLQKQLTHGVCYLDQARQSQVQMMLGERAEKSKAPSNHIESLLRQQPGAAAHTAFVSCSSGCLLAGLCGGKIQGIQG